MKQIKFILLTAMLLLSASGCAWWDKTGKTVVRDVDTAARALCALFYSDSAGLSVDDAARLYCKTREQWSPWIDAVLSGVQTGGARAGAAPGKAGQESPPYLPGDAAEETGGPTPQPPPTSAPAGQPGPATAPPQGDAGLPLKENLDGPR